MSVAKGKKEKIKMQQANPSAVSTAKEVAEKITLLEGKKESGSLANRPTGGNNSAAGKSSVTLEQEACDRAIQNSLRTFAEEEKKRK